MTLAEVLVAMLVLLVGALGVGTVLGQGNRVTGDNLVRDRAMALAREELEVGREVPFSTLPEVTNLASKLTSTVTGAVPASLVSTTLPSLLPGHSLPSLLPNGSLSYTPPTMPIPIPALRFNAVRNGVTYASTVATCVLDDPSDGIGPAPGTSCMPIPAGSGGGGSVSTSGTASLNLNVLGIQVTGGGALVELVCNLLGSRGSLVDGLLGGGGLLSGLLNNGADVLHCPSKGNAAFDRQATDAVAITALVEFTYPGTSRTGSVAQRVVVSGPRVTS